MGDLNARLGDSVHSIVSDRRLKYNVIDRGVNDSGKRLAEVFKDNDLLVVNNLSTRSSTFTGALTFRQRNRWISELDLSVVSKSLIDHVSSFNVNQDTTIPSNHAPISTQIMFPKRDLTVQQILSRSADIGSYPTPQKPLCKKPISYSRISNQTFVEKISAVNPTLAPTDDIETLATDFSNLIYETIKESKLSIPTPEYDPDMARWQRIMECGDKKLLWKAIDWKGQFKPETHDGEIQPSEEEFREHLEKLLNPGEEPITTDLSDYHTTIPILDDRIRPDEVKEVLDFHVKPEKGCGPDGNSPGVYKLLPNQWIAFLCVLFNLVFVAEQYFYSFNLPC